MRLILAATLLLLYSNGRADEPAAAAAPATTVHSASAPVVAPYRVPVQLFAGQVRGPYQTGTYDELWVDQARDELATDDTTDKRHLMVQIWYPAEFKGDPLRAPYVLNRALYPSDGKTKWIDEELDAMQPVRTNSVLSAPLAAQPRQFPILIYSPGGGQPHFTGTFAAEFLASHGYVVVAVAHTGNDPIRHFPDGYDYKAKEEPDADQTGEAHKPTPMEAFEAGIKDYSTHLMPLEVQDLRFVIDRLQALAATRGDRWYQRLDFEHIGAFGWSLGGALSLQASRDEPRIKAAVNHDGWLYTDVADTGTHRPVMVIGYSAESDATTPAAEREIEMVGNSRFWRMFARTDADWYSVDIKHVSHGHFSDLSLSEAADHALIHPRLAHDIINAYTLEFFDKYLRGHTDSPLLSGKNGYPEVTLIARPAAAPSP
jgi:predicted dienelactone hydrolase